MSGILGGLRVANCRPRATGTGLQVFLVCVLVATGGGAAQAQHEEHRSPASGARRPKPEARIPDLGWEPIRCWRQASSGAVSIGETFTVVLTCAVYEGDNAQVVPDESRLGVAAIQMAPFEILGGTHPPDVRRGTRRFFQYDYQLRIISPDAIGQDINIPPLTISYRVHSRVGAAATLEGRDLSYLMPMMPIKVLSLVPAEATDIRDASEARLAAVETLRFRSNVFQVMALTFGALAAVMVVLALIPLARSTATVAASERDRIPDRAILAETVRALSQLQSQAVRDGWSSDAAGRALALTRIVAAAAIEQPISVKPLANGAATPDGRLRVAHGAIRKIVGTASSAVTADEVNRVRRARGSTFSTTRQQQLETLEAGLSSMTAVLYGRDASRAPGTCDDVVRQAIAAAQEVGAERSWFNRLRRGSGGR